MIDPEDAKRQTEEILKEFDFKKLETAMVAVDWKWYYGKWHGNDHRIVPTVPMLRDAARQHLEHVAQMELGTTGGGGFEASNDGVQLTLTFVFEQVEGYVMGYDPHGDEVYDFREVQL